MSRNKSDITCLSRKVDVVYQRRVLPHLLRFIASLALSPLLRSTFRPPPSRPELLSPILSCITSFIPSAKLSFIILIRRYVNRLTHGNNRRRTFVFNVLIAIRRKFCLLVLHPMPFWINKQILFAQGFE